MEKFRLGKTDTAHYTSLGELRKAFKLKELSTNKEKTAELQVQFTKNKTCRACHQPLTYIGGSVLACQNPDCKGIKHTSKNEDGSIKTYFTPSFMILKKKSDAKYAEKIFG